LLQTKPRQLTAIAMAEKLGFLIGGTAAYNLLKISKASMDWSTSAICNIRVTGF
jgi:lipid-binding SYLF domain-containing protein